MVELRSLDLSNSQEVKSLVERVSSHYHGAVPMTERAVMSGSTRYFWAYLGKDCVGVSGYIPRTQTLAETVKTVVWPEHRGKGLGKALSQAIEDQVRKDGFKKAMTTIYIDNFKMIMIKLKQGYRFEGFHPDHERPGWHEYSFGKIL